jgi:glycosyltransferase involved in cell wall biosynthesis
MKIAYIYDAVYPWVKGGAEKRIYEIAKRLASRGHEVHWYGIGWWLNDHSSRTIEYEGIILHGVCEPMPLYIDGRRNISEATVFSEKLFPGLIKEGFDVVDCQEFPYFPCFTAKFCSLLRKSRLVITWHEVWDKYWFKYLGKKGLFGWVVERLASRLASENVAVSKRTRRDLEKIGVKNVKVIPNGIDLKKIESVKPSSGEKSDVIFVGRLIKDKNVDVLIEAISLIKMEMPDIRCVIVGDGPERGKLIKLAKELRVEDNVKFTGFLENYDDVIAYMKSSKVFVLPSTREGFGIVALEANACGLPVVTVNHEGNAVCDFINCENGFVCKLSAEDIAENILVGVETGKVLREKCIENAMRYDWDIIVDTVESFYKEVKL